MAKTRRTAKTAKISYQKNLEWLRPFVQSASTLVPTQRIVRIQGYKMGYKGQDFTEGTIYTKRSDGGGEALISLATHLFNSKGPRAYVNILQTLAHELAHLKHWDHSPEHWALESKIALRFARVARSLDIRDVSGRVRL